MNVDSLAALSGLGYSRPLVAEALKQVSLLLPLWYWHEVQLWHRPMLHYASEGRCKEILPGMQVLAISMCLYPVCTSQLTGSVPRC